MKLLRRSVIPCASALAFGLGQAATSSSLSAASPAAYEIVDLGVFHGTRAEGRMINNQSRILCIASPATDSGWFLSEGGVESPLANLPESSSTTFSGLNDRGFLVGTVSYPGPRGTSGFIGTPDKALSLAPPNTEAHGLNNLGAGVGVWNTKASFGPFYPPFPVRRAMRFFGGSLRDLGTLSSDNPFSDSDALAINDRGTVVGWSTLGGKIGKKAVRWVGGGKIENIHTDPIEGRANSAAIAIGQDGSITGYAFNFPTAMDAIPFLWTVSNGMQALPLLTGDNRAVPLGMNSRREVVGAGYSSETAILWKTNRALILQDLLPKGSGWDLDAAYAINDAGQIVGYGKKDGQTRAFLMSPGRVPSRPNIRWELIDPYPLLITRAGVTADHRALSEAGGLCAGVAAEGAARLLLRLESDRPGEFLVSLDAAEGALGVVGDVREDGSLSRMGATTRGVTVSLRTVLKTPRGHQAFLLYNAPSAFDRVGEDDSHAAFRALAMSLRFHPDEGEEVAEGLNVSIARPPVVVFHGLWSNMNDAFGGFRQQMLSLIPDLQVTGPDYPNAASFNENRTRVRDGIQDALDLFRSKGYAVARADVFGHSMGGVLSRIWSQHPRSIRPQNYNAGDMNRLITIDSPLHGAFIADALLALRTADPDRYRDLALFMRSLGDPIDEGAGEDLSTFSRATSDANARSAITPSHAIIGDYEIEGAWLGVIKSVGVSFDMTGLSRLLQRMFPSDAPLDTYSDLLVSVSSQSGGLSAGQTSIHGHWHMGAANQSDVVLRCEALLNTWPDHPKYARGFPTWSAPFVVPPPSSLRTALASIAPPPPGRLRIVAPVEGAVWKSGQTLSVIGSVSDGVTPKTVLLSTRGVLNENPDGALAFSLTLPAEAIGPQSITLMAQDAAGKWVSSTVGIQVKPNGALIGLRAEPGSIHIHGLGRTSRLRVLGLYSDQVEHDVTSSFAGTTFFCGNTNVVSVDAEGTLTSRATGYATVVATLAGQTATADVFVEDPTFPFLRPELRVRVDGDHLRLQLWGVDAGSQLESSDALSDHAAWTLVRAISDEDPADMEWSVPIPSAPRFWRLISSR